MEAARSQTIGGEEVYIITAIGDDTTQAEQIRRDARNLHVQEYVRRFEERQQTIGVAVDMQL